MSTAIVDRQCQVQTWLGTVWMVWASKKVLPIFFFHNFDVELSEITYENFWSNILPTCITFASQNASICQGIWAYLHLFIVCCCESDTLPKATIFMLAAPSSFRGDLKISDQNIWGGDLSKKLNLGGAKC